MTDIEYSRKERSISSWISMGTMASAVPAPSSPLPPPSPGPGPAPLPLDDAIGFDSSHHVPAGGPLTAARSLHFQVTSNRSRHTPYKRAAVVDHQVTIRYRGSGRPLRSS